MEERIVLVKMGAIDVVSNSSKITMKLKVTLGSCVGVVLSDCVRNVHGLAHIMLPKKFRKKDQSAGKYAETAIPLLLAKMEKEGCKKKDLQAFIAGGACMFRQVNGSSLNTIGAMNVQAAKKILVNLGIPIVFEDTGGNYGRTILFDSADRSVSVNTLNKFCMGGARG